MKSWISKALLGLCIAAPATMADLPQKPGRFGGVHLNISPVLSNQGTAIRNAFGLWFQNMDWDMRESGATAFRLVNSVTNPDYVVTVNFVKVSGVSPRVCGSDVVSKCAYTITDNTFDGVTYKAPTVTIYTQVQRNGVVQNIFTTNKAIFQNAMTEAVGELLRVEMDLSISGRYRNDNEIWIPADFACGLAEIYSAQASGSCYIYSGTYIHHQDGGNGIPVLQLGRYNSSGARVGTAFIRNERQSTSPIAIVKIASVSVGGSDYYVLENARAIFVSTQSGASDSRAITLNGGRIGVADNRNGSVRYPSCYTSTLPAFQTLQVATVGPDDVGQAANYTPHGAVLANYARNSLANGDYFVPNQSGLPCGTNMGYVVDLLDGR